MVICVTHMLAVCTTDLVVNRCCRGRYFKYQNEFNCLLNDKLLYKFICDDRVYFIKTIITAKIVLKY